MAGSIRGDERPGKTGLTPFTVVIPTRERSDTLKFSLESCVRQKYENLTIIVSDNYSQDDTEQVVRAAGDSRVRYINTGKRVGMSANWEFALAHVPTDEDGFVSFIGDDDALLPDALSQLDVLIAKLNARVISWTQAIYYWPQSLRPAWRDILVIPLQRGLKRESNKTILQNALRFRSSYERLPMVYNSVVSYGLLRKVLKLQENIFFRSSNPDIYSGVAVACVSESHYQSAQPFSVSGISQHSIGHAHMFGAQQSEIRRQWDAEGNIDYHSLLVPAAELWTIESVLQAQKWLPAARELKIDFSLVLRTMMSRAVTWPAPRYEHSAQAALEVGRRNRMEEYARQVISKNPNRPLPELAPSTGFSFLTGSLKVHASDFGVSDVYGASLLCRRKWSFGNAGYRVVARTIKNNFVAAMRIVPRSIAARRLVLP